MKMLVCALDKVANGFYELRVTSYDFTILCVGLRKGHHRTNIQYMGKYLCQVLFFVMSMVKIARSHFVFLDGPLREIPLVYLAMCMICFVIRLVVFCLCS